MARAGKESLRCAEEARIGRGEICQCHHETHPHRNCEAAGISSTSSRFREFYRTASRSHSSLPLPITSFASSQDRWTIVDVVKCVRAKGASEGQPRLLLNCPAALSHQPKFNVCAKLRRSSLANCDPCSSTIYRGTPNSFLFFIRASH